MPGHMNPMLGQHPDLALRRANGYLSLDHGPGATGWDLAYDFVNRLLLGQRVVYESG